jgi:hypothetical protein
LAAAAATRGHVLPRSGRGQTRVCVLDAQNLCVGCLRTLDEIAGWEAMSRTERIAVLGRVERRAAARSVT